MNWYMSTTALKGVNLNMTYVSYHIEDDEEMIELNLEELSEQPNTTITDYGLSL